MSKTIKQLNKELDKLGKIPGNIKDYSRFHKGKDKWLCFSAPVLRKFSLDQFKKVKDLDKSNIFLLCEEFLGSKKIGARTIAFDWAFRVREQYTKQDFKIFESWIKKHIDSWGSCDDLCTHALGDLIYQFPELSQKTKKWSRSKKIWLRRASAVSLIYSVRREQSLSEIFDVSDMLLLDEEDLVQKGYGWALKEASNVYPKEVFNFVIERKNKMPRTALRYAIEKMPINWKKEAMKTK